MRPPLVILAGGKGTRLGDLTKDIPKPMVDVCGKPFLYWLIEHYLEQGFTDITISLGYKAHVIENHSWPWTLKFRRDAYSGQHMLYYEYPRKHWVVNGDTWIVNPLPHIDEKNPVILSHLGIDAGAQYVTSGKIEISQVSGFYDIGTPDGIEVFINYMKGNITR